MDILKLILGIVLVLFTIAAVIWSVVRTPDNLRGFYGLMFAIIALAGLIGGAALIAFAFIS